MGACGEEKEKKTDKNPAVTNTGEKENQIIPIDEKEVDKLRSNKPKKSYSLKFIDSHKNKEYNETIEGETTLNKILTKINIRQNSDYIIELDNDIKIGMEKKDSKFGDLVNELFKNEVPEVINMKYSYKGLDIPEDSKQAYIENNKIIGSAILDNNETLGIITYENDNNNINSYYFQRDDYPELNYLNSFTAYCNAKNCLYFSGGEKEEPYEQEENVVKYDEFIRIDLTELDRNKDKLEINQLSKLNVPRTWHSMIFVPNKYIFIVGGSNTNSVELYDIEENKLTEDSELKQNRCECSLCLVNNMYLYAFCGFKLHEEYNNSIERCNLLKDKREWEIINTIEKCRVEFKPSFFAISYFQNKDLFLIGGNDEGDDERCDYIYKVGIDENEEDKIEKYKFELKENINIFKDKFFMPTTNNKSINIPLIIGGEIKVIIIDTQNGEVNICEDNK